MIVADTGFWLALLDKKDSYKLHIKVEILKKRYIPDLKKLQKVKEKNGQTLSVA
jgi:hypothetical protein